MPAPIRRGLGEVAITTTLLTVYLGARSTSRTLGAVQSAMAGLERARGRPGRGERLLPA